MKRTLTIFAVIMLAAALLFTGCAKMADEAEYAPSVRPNSGTANIVNDKESFSGEINPTVPDQDADLPSAFTGRKVIRNADLNIETLEYDKFISTVTERVNAMGGYIQANNMRTGGSARYGMRYADITVRVPAEKLDSFLNEVNGLGNITWRTENVDDVTDAYTDVEARLVSLRTEYDTLISLLEQAGSLDEIITLQDRLANVRYEIESYEARKRNYDSLVDMSTVHMSVSEVESVSPADKESFGQEVSRRFKDSLSTVGDGFRAFAVWLIGDSPAILLSLIVLGLIALIVILCVRGSRKRKQKRYEEVMRKKAEEKRSEE